MKLIDPEWPRVVRRLKLMEGAAVLATIVAGAAVFWIPDAFGLEIFRGTWGDLVPILLFSGPIFAFLLVEQVQLARCRRRLAVTDGRCCTACLHNLRGLGESGVCPECGATFDVTADRKAWRKARLLRDGAG